MADEPTPATEDKPAPDFSKDELTKVEWMAGEAGKGIHNKPLQRAYWKLEDAARAVRILESFPENGDNK